MDSVGDERGDEGDRSTLELAVAIKDVLDVAVAEGVAVAVAGAQFAPVEKESPATV